MRSFFIFSLMIGVAMGGAAAETGPDRYEWLKQLNGDWVLAPAGQQQGKATQHKLVAPLVGTAQVAHSYRVTARGSTVQETLLPGTKKEMVTMFHCDNSDCNSVKATHYCVKQNQPQLIAASTIADNTLVFDCDMSTELCRSGMDHIHTCLTGWQQ
jgi:hypothetical protein